MAILLSEVPSKAILKPSKHDKTCQKILNWYIQKWHILTHNMAFTKNQHWLMQPTWSITLCMSKYNKHPEGSAILTVFSLYFLIKNLPQEINFKEHYIFLISVCISSLGSWLCIEMWWIAKGHRQNADEVIVSDRFWV